MSDFYLMFLTNDRQIYQTRQRSMWINDIFIVITKDQRGVGRGADAFYVRNYIFGRIVGHLFAAGIGLLVYGQACGTADGMECVSGLLAESVDEETLEGRAPLGT